MATVTVHCLPILLLFSSSFRVSKGDYNVENFGAKPDGKTDSTEAFQKAWSSACTSTEPATVYVPRGGFLVKTIVFSGPCKNKMLFWIDGKMLTPSNYLSFGSSRFWILFYKVSMVTIHGGILDARGGSFWACRRAGKVCPPGARKYCHGGHGCPDQNSGEKISGVTYKNIRGTSATQVAMKFVCSASNPCIISEILR